MLIARDLVVEIGAKTIVDGVDLNVRAGEKVGLVGRNGAGKTTIGPGTQGMILTFDASSD